MKTVVSVSLGSSARDFCHELDLGGSRLLVERRGCNGDISKACAMIADLDGRVDAIGLGGVNLSYGLGARQYPCPDGQRLAQSAHITPVVDGSLFKNTYETSIPREITGRGVRLAGTRALVVSVLDRWGLAEALNCEGASVLVGDAAMALGLPIVFRGLKTFSLVAGLSMWGLCRIPIGRLYPLGRDQHDGASGREWAFAGVDMVAGDYHFIRRYMPERLPGVWVLTTTTRESDRLHLWSAGVKGVITMAPPIEGRSFGANVFDAIAVALAGKRQVSCEEATSLWKQIGLAPHIEDYGH